MSFSRAALPFSLMRASGKSIREISMVTHWTSPERVHASMSQTRSPPMDSPISTFQSPTHFTLPSYIFSLSCNPAVHRRTLGPPTTIAGRHEHGGYVKGLACGVFHRFLVCHLGPGLSASSTVQ